jgi:hypothetical protein
MADRRVARTVDRLDPFVLPDESKSDDRRDDLAGIADHPHRGFEDGCGVPGRPLDSGR